MNIIYGINADGLGHAVRSIPIIKHLKNQGHNIHIITDKNVKDFLGSKYGNYTLISQMLLGYKEEKISYWKTILDNVYLTKKNMTNILKIKNVIKKFKPDIIISDLETFSLWAGEIFEIPTISIDNHATIFRGEIDFNIKDTANYLTSKSISKIICPHADRYFGLSFYKTKIKKKNTKFFDPVFLEEQLNYKPNKENYILVYNRFLDKKTIDALKKIKDQKFILFGAKKNYTQKNITYKKMGTPNMWKYIANAKAFVTNGGHTSICEAILFKTPIYSIPVKRQFEQTSNALYVQKKKFGEKHSNLTKNKLNDFLLKLDLYKHYLNKHKFKDSKYFFRELDKTIEELVKKK
jgi:uncharacterized protein (TIGR00661 family)